MSVVRFILPRAGATALFAAMLSACSATNTSPTPATLQPQSLPDSAGGLVQSAALQAREAGSPYIRTQPDGTVVHIHPLPQVRTMFPLATAKDVTYHGGPVVHKAIAYAIFWQPPGSYVSAKYQSTIEDFFTDVGATAQYNILTQYTDTSGPILNQATLGGTWTDTSAYPADFNKGTTGDADLHAEVLKAIQINHWPNGGVQPIFFIFTASHSPADSWAACAYHGSFPANGRNYLYSIVPYQHDYGTHGCGTPSNTWPNDRDGDQTVDTLWHEYAESVSDPITTSGKGAWYNNSGEIGDLCQTSYGPLRSDGSNVTDGDSRFVTQEIWSNYHSRCYQTQASRP